MSSTTRSKGEALTTRADAAEDPRGHNPDARLRGQEVTGRTRRSPEMSTGELLAIPVTVDIRTAGRAFGLGEEKSYELAKQGEFPCPVLRVGRRYRVTRHHLFEALGMEPGSATAPSQERPPPLRSNGVPAN
jgi:hypothetical protein